jgi:N-acetyl-anhydromuramyl-L-alanine amidase AmpD
MEAPESSTRAERCAKNFAREGARKASCHYCVDSDSIVQCVKEDRIAWHCPGANRRGIGIEHAGYARQSREQWLDLFGQNMLGLSAKLAARICRRWGIPAVAVDIDGLKGGERGITTHAAVGKAFGKTKHWDPGPSFPMDWYVDAVKVELDKLKQPETPT